MSKEFYRAEFQRLIVSASSAATLESFDRVFDTAFKLYEDATHIVDHKNEVEYESYLLYQMTFLKGLSVKKLYEGLTYTNPMTNSSMGNFKDPFSMYPIVRSQFEAYCIFNNIYLQHSGEEQLAIYYLWVVSGLKYRQSFGGLTLSPELQTKLHDEAQDIDKYINLLKALPVYQALNVQDQTYLNDQLLKRKNFQGKFLPGPSLRKQDWRELFKAAVSNDKFDELYTDLSLKTHPSNVSVFQFHDLFRAGGDEDLSAFALNLSRIIMAFLIRDFVKAFPALEMAYVGYDKLNQMVIDSVNRIFRGDAFQISNISHELLD